MKTLTNVRLTHVPKVNGWSVHVDGELSNDSKFNDVVDTLTEDSLDNEFMDWAVRHGVVIAISALLGAVNVSFDTDHEAA